MERRNLLGTGAVIVGLGSALISGAAVASADTGGPDGQQTDKASRSASAPRASAPDRRGSTRAKPRPAPAASADEAPPAGRKNSSTLPSAQRPQPSAATAPATEEPATAAPATAAPEAPAVVPDAAAPAEAPAPAPAAAGPARVTVVRTANDTPPATVVQRIADPAPAAKAAAAKPVRDFLTSVVDALGGGSGSPAVATTPALAAFSGQRKSAAPAAVTGSQVSAGAPPIPTLPGFNNGVTGVQVGHSRLEMPGAFIGKTVAADWYFPTQVDGSVDAQGVIWLQHGFGAANFFYSALAKDLAQRTNSIVVAPTLSSIPFTFSGGCLNCATSQEAAAAAFLDPTRSALVDSAVAAGYTGDPDQLRGKFAVSGHSAGGGFASAVGGDYIGQGSDAQDANLVGVVMYDGVSNGAFDGTFEDQVKTLAGAGKPIYQIAAPAQAWNAFGATTNQLVNTLPGQFVGVVLNDGSHVDSVLGVNPLFDFVLQLVAGRVPPGNTAATHLLSTGWVNDMYGGNTPQTAEYGFYAGANSPIIMGPTAAIGLPTQIANPSTPLYKLTAAVLGLFGMDISSGIPTSTDNGIDGVIVPPLSNGVTGLRTGSAVLNIPSGNGYAAPADWYFPTQADGTVAANGVIWLQHGFLGFNGWYSDMARALAQETNSIVVVPQINWFDDAFSGEAAAEMFVGDRGSLNLSASLAGLQGPLPEKFILTGHSAGGNFATVAGAGTVDNGAAKDLLGVVMFDGVSFPEVFPTAIAKLDSLNIPDYQIAATPQSWNAWGTTTDQLALLHPDQFIGVLIDDGSHTDSVQGDSLFARLAAVASDILVKPSPPGGKEAVRTFATGWVNDLYGGFDPASPVYGFYGNPNDGTYVPNQPMVMGEAGATTLPAPPPVDVNQYAGKWYEQGSVRQFFSIGLVNTTATYTPQPDGSIKVENSGQYFGPNGPAVDIVGAAVPVNSPTNTRLNVGFGPRPPGASDPGNYWIIDYAPDYSWAIVSDSSLRSGYILTRDQTISEDQYDALVARAQELGVRGRIQRTEQFPPAPAAALPGPAAVPATIAV